MIKNELNESQITSLILSLSSVCNKLNNSLPQSQQVAITTSIQSILKGIQNIADKIIQSFKAYEKIIQNLEDNLRRHIKNQIQLKLYYEHLQDVIGSLKRQKIENEQAIHNLKTDLTLLKQKEKYFMTLSNNSNNNTKNYEDFNQYESKLDTITKIKNRLSLNGTEQFYTNYIVKKIDKQLQTRQLQNKRQSLANTLRQLYESPIGNKKIHNLSKKSKNKQKQPSNSRSKSKQKKSKTKEIDKLNESSKSRKSLKNRQSTKLIRIQQNNYVKINDKQLKGLQRERQNSIKMEIRKQKNRQKEVYRPSYSERRKNSKP